MRNLRKNFFFNLNFYEKMNYPQCIYKIDDIKCINKASRYGIVKNKQDIGLYCRNHKTDYYEGYKVIQLQHKRCENCREVYIEKNKTLCVNCNILINGKKDNICKFEDCQKTGWYGSVKNKQDIYQYCENHKDPNIPYIDLKQNRCVNCRVTRAKYGKEGTKTATHCTPCVKLLKLILINVVDPKCIICKKKQPTFNEKETGSAIYCAGCAKLKNIEVINVLDKKCINCNKIQPVFGKKETKTATHCASCVKLLNLDMIDIINKKCINCNEIRSIFGKKGTKNATHCISCVKILQLDLVDVKNKKCINCNDTSISNSQYKGHCQYCFIHIFPNEPISRNFRIKERLVVDFVKNFMNTVDINYKIYCDKQLLCSRRPDIYIEIFEENSKYSENFSEVSHYIIIEIDELQHKDNRRKDYCETVRTNQIIEELNKPGIFIRFNPDEYILKGQKNSSCFYLNQRGLCSVFDKYDWKRRLENLQYHINYWLKHKPIFKKTSHTNSLNSLNEFEDKDNDIPIVYLYYDEMI